MDDDFVALDRGWSLWPQVALRATGFAAALLDELAIPLAAIDRMLALDDAAAAARARAIAELERVIESLAGDARKPIGKALRKLRAAQPVALEPADEGARAALAALAAAAEAAAAARTEAERAFGADAGRISAALQRIAGDPRFREAIAWQNPGALATAVDRVRDGRAGSPSQHRQHEQLVARYLQRYCTKNDTIGFFGPLGFARLSARGPAVLRPGPSLLAARTVYFEHWPLIALADQLSSDPELKPQLAPRRGAIGRLTLPDDIAAVLARCDGVRPAREIALELLEGDHGFADEGEVYEVLGELETRRLVTWSIEVPFDTATPLTALRERLAPLHGAARDRMLGVLDELEAQRAQLAACAGDAAAIERGLRTLGHTFERVTGQAGTRRAGENYAGRLPVFEDCERDLELRLPASFSAGFATALALVLDSARWLTYALGEHARTRLRRAFDELAGGEPVPFDRLFERVPELATAMTTADSDVVGELVRELDRKWREVLGFSDDDVLVQRSSAELADRAAAAFAAPRLGWWGARHHSIDLMIAARSFDEVARGDGLAVLAELHPGGVQLATPVFLRGAPWGDEVRAQFRRGGRPNAMIPVAKHHANRTSCGPGFPAELTLDIGMRRDRATPETTLSPDELVAELRDGELIVRTRDGRAVFEAVSFCASWIVDAVANRFSVVRPVRHLPRIVIDRLVVRRRTWVMAPDELAFAKLDRGFDQVASARRWATAHDLPRWVFAKIPEELKPVFVDLASPLSIEMLAWLARRASRVTLSEMVPSLDELWLPDAAGARYTCELRLAARDPLSR